MRKRTLIRIGVLSAMISTLFLSACVQQQTDIEAIATETPIATATIEATPAPTQTLEATPMPTEDVVPTFSRGVTEGLEYRSEFFKLGCKLDDAWTIATAEDLAQLNGVAADALENYDAGQQYLDQLESGSVFFDFSATAESGMRTIIISAQDATEMIDGTLEMESVLEMCVQPMLDLLEQSGMEIIGSEIKKVDFGGTELSAIVVEADYSDIPVYVMALISQRGSYFTTINITSIGKDNTAEILKYFYVIE